MFHLSLLIGFRCILYVYMYNVYKHLKPIKMNYDDVNGNW